MQSQPEGGKARPICEPMSLVFWGINANVTRGLKSKFPFDCFKCALCLGGRMSHDDVLCLVTKSERLAERQNGFHQLIGSVNSDLPSSVCEGVRVGPTPALNTFVLHPSSGLSAPCVSAEVAQELKTNILMCRKPGGCLHLANGIMRFVSFRGSREGSGLTGNFLNVVLTDTVRSQRQKVRAGGCEK